MSALEVLLENEMSRYFGKRRRLADARCADEGNDTRAVRTESQPVGELHHL